MDGRLATIAWSIVSDVYSQCDTKELLHPRLLTEVTRLTALNIVLKSQFSSDDLGFEDSDLAFANLSYEGERLGISKKNIHDLVKRELESSSVELPAKLHNLSLNDFVNVLGWIHSLSSYRLPSKLNHGSFQRSLGAYYTPPDLANYIVNLTMKEELERRVKAISKDGIESFEDFISIHILDPACGAGVFLISVSNLLLATTLKAIDAARVSGVQQSDIDDVLKSRQPGLYGVDLDLGALEVADLSLRILEWNVTGSIPSSKIGKTLKRGNSLISFHGLQGVSNHKHFFKNPSRMNAFEWPREFPEIFSEPDCGFDFVIMNPPYERLKPNLAEFIRERLLSGDREIHTDIYEDHKRNIRESTNYFRESNEYRLATSYSINTYQLFIERALQITQNGGTIGCIIPSNILGDVSAQRLRANLLQ
ncbi:MAG: Eco57I restriction-modification methylase domain-containing protein, partial [Candidatus Thorarchaeota archaeon]